jgi:hypothetical protein
MERFSVSGECWRCELAQGDEMMVRRIGDLASLLLFVVVGDKQLSSIVNLT